jgi:hypothetical protein
MMVRRPEGDRFQPDWLLIASPPSSQDASPPVARDHRHSR